MNKQNELEKAIIDLDSQRAILGDTTVDAAIKALRKQIAELKKPERQVAQQRKLATILFADIVGHTQLIQNLDPEDNMEIIDGALVRLAKVVESYGGHIARFQGDGFKAIFGVPTAHESDPEKAIRAGLGIITVAQAYARELEAEWNLTGFNVRIGIDTGLVVTGGQTEAGDTIKGLVVNLAARLESAAPPGGLLISHNTYQHVRGVFNVQSQEPIQAKGFPEPVPTYLVMEAKPRAFRLGTRGVEGIATKTIGRDHELRQLQTVYKTAVKESQTNVVTLVGEAGVGKSRLLHEFDKWLELRSELIRYFKGRASQQTQGIPHFLLRDMLATRFQILDSDPLTAVRRKFVAGLAEFLPHETEMKAHILGAWLGYDFNDSPHLQPLADDPEQIKNRSILYLAQFLTAIGKSQPVVIFLEDIHWADNGSLDTIINLVRRWSQLPLLIVCLARPALYQRQSTWENKIPIHTRLDLTPLSGADTRTLVMEILRQINPLPQLLLDLISNRAEGNPFYAEELVKMLIDDGVIVPQAEAWRVAPQQLLELKVPPTLTGVLQARLDRLQPGEKQTAQQASVIGRIFWDRALAALPHEGQLALSTLQAKEFIFPREDTAFVGTSEYIFKHALLRDVTYETVLKRARRHYHALVADWLASAAADNGRSDEYAPLIGEHYQLADKLESAAIWYRRAGELAAATFSHEEAVRYLSLALQFSPEDDIANRFTLLTAREKAYDMQGNRAAQRQDLEQLASLANRLDATKQAMVVLWRSKLAYATSDYDQAIIYAQKVIELAHHEDDKRLMAGGYWAWGMALLEQAQDIPAEKHLRLGLQLAEEAGDQRQAANCLNRLGIAAKNQGNNTTARKHQLQSLKIHREIGNRRGEGVSLNNLGIESEEQGDYAAAKGYYEQSLALSREIGDRWGEGVSLNNLGVVAIDQGDYATAKQNHEQSLAIWLEIGDRRGEGTNLNNLANVAYYQVDYELAKVYLQQSLALSREIGNRRGEGISLYIFGCVSMQQKDYATAHKYLQEALAVGQETGNPLIKGISFQELGALAFAKANLPLAETYFQRAVAFHQELNQLHYLVEDWAGLAKLKLAQSDRESARQYGQQIISYVRKSPHLDGSAHPVRTFRLTWEVLIALDQTTEADEILALAAQYMQGYLDKNSDPDIHAMYLLQTHHKVLWAAWQEKRKDY